MDKPKKLIFSILLGILIFIPLDYFVYNFLIIETDYQDEYRFPKLALFLDFFFYGNHYDTNDYYFILILLLGIFISFKLLCIFKVK